MLKYQNEASFYLKERDWDYWAALSDYKADLQIEVDLFTKEKE